jgi:hypothetical protein
MRDQLIDTMFRKWPKRVTDDPSGPGTSDAGTQTAFATQIFAPSSMWLQRRLARSGIAPAQRL